MSADYFRISIVRGTLADIPPRPSILAQLEGAAEHGRRCIESLERDCQRAAESKARRASCAAKDHEVRIVRFLRKRADWVSTAAIRNEIERRTGVMLNPGDIGKVLRARGDFDSKVVKERTYWKGKA